MSLTFKLLSLVIRTAAKPIGNYIKRQAQEHEGFRRFAISQAQRVHRIDMRMRLGLLHDPETQQRMRDREKRAAEDRQKKAETPTVRTEEEQKKYDKDKAREERDGGKKKKESESSRVKIRPLSDARAIELGANFFSEAFIFMVAVGLLLAENYRSSRKASNRRDEVQERLDGLEAEVVRLRNQHNLPELEELNESIKRAKQTSWWNPAGWWRRTEPDVPEEREGQPTPQENKDAESNRIPGNVPGKPPEQAIKPADASSDSVKGSNGATPVRVDTVDAEKKER